MNSMAGRTPKTGFKQLDSCNVKLQSHETRTLIPYTVKAKRVN